MATEISVIYYGLIHWKQKPAKDNEFSGYKKSTSVSMFLGIMLIIVIEAFVFHSILKKEGNPRAWFVSFLSIYSLIQILGFLKSLIKRPISFDGNVLNLRYGIMKETSINLNNISSVVLSSENKDKKISRLSIFGEHESHNVILTLKEDEILYCLYGYKKKYLKISFFVDEPKIFLDKVCESIKEFQLKLDVN